MPVAKALLERYDTLLASGISAAGPEYLWRYAWRHAAAAGPAGLEPLRALAAREDALLPDVALAAQEVGGRLAGWGYRMEAVDPTEEAVHLYRELAAANPAFLPDLAMALNNLGNRYSEAGTPDRGEAIWEQAITEAAPSAGAFLSVARARGTEQGNADVAGWLVRSLALDGEDRDLQGSVHELARHHRVPDPAAFDENWARHAGRPVPAWLTIDPVLLAAAEAWVATDTYTAERDYLAGHPELLEPDADTAVAEALLAVSEQEASRYSALRQAAQQDGVDAAYQPLLLTILAREFATADPDRQRELLRGAANDHAS